MLPAFLIIAILSPSFRGKTWLIFVLLLAAFQWMITARIVRGMTLSLQGARVRAGRALHGRARLAGSSSATSCPNMSSLLIIDATINVSALILAEVGLSFFGFGVQPPDVSLGTLIGDYAGVGADLPLAVLLSRPACSSCSCSRSTSSATACATRSIRTHRGIELHREHDADAALRCSRSRDLSVDVPQRGRAGDRRARR